MVFSIPSFTTVGDQYQKKKVIDQRSHGKSFVAVSGRVGNMPDALFEKQFKSIHEGDRFVELNVAERRYKNEKLKKNLTTNGFRFSSPSQKASGLGSHYGTLQGTPFRHETDFVVPRKGEAPPKPHHEPRAIFTSPPKKGTFGFSNICLSNIGQEYVASFYDQGREDAKKDRQRHEALMKGQPFKLGGRKGTTFDEGPMTGATTCFMLTKPLQPRKQKAVPPKKKAEQPWRPCGPVFKNTKCEYREDPYDGYDPREGPKKKAHGSSDKAAWKPNSNTDNHWYSCSIAFKRL